MQAVILAAGRGKRLHPITATRTKAMAPILGKPIIERVMDTLIINGIQEFVLVTSPDDAEISDYFRNYPLVNVILEQQPEPLGMGHALLQALPHIHGDFILSSCDNLVEAFQIKNMLSTWEIEKPDAILSTLRVRPEEIIRMGIVGLNGKWVARIVEKPNLDEAPSDIGSLPLYVFSYKILEYLSEIKPSPRGEYEIQDAVQMLIDREGRVRAFQLDGRIDLTTPEDLLALNLRYFAAGCSQRDVQPQNVGTGTQFIDPVFIESNVNLGLHSQIGPNVYIECGCTVGDFVHLENVVVLRGREVAPRTIAKDKVIW